MEITIITMFGVVMDIMMEYGDERVIMQVLIDEQIKQTQQRDNDHVLSDGMYLVHENGDC